MTDFTFDIDPATGDFLLDDGHPKAAASVALGLVVWTLRTPVGTCLAAPTRGVDWSAAKVDRPGATVTLRRELERALGWIAEAGYLSGLAVTVDSPARGRLRYEIAFDAEGQSQRVRGTV